MPNAAELNRAIGTPDGKCPKCPGGLWYRPIASSHAYVCDQCSYLTFDLVVDMQDGELPEGIPTQDWPGT